MEARLASAELSSAALFSAGRGEVGREDAADMGDRSDRSDGADKAAGPTWVSTCKIDGGITSSLPGESARRDLNTTAFCVIGEPGALAIRLGEDGPAGRTGEAGAACGELPFNWPVAAAVAGGTGDFDAAVFRSLCGEDAGDTPGDTGGLPGKCSCLCGELRCD